MSSSSCSSFSVESDIPRFPNEVTEKILSYCDGLTLFRTLYANSKLQEIVIKRIKWELKCKHDLSPYIYQELMLKMYPKYWFSQVGNQLNINWMGVYEAWLLWNNFSQCYSKKIFISDFDINCIEISGNWVFLGSDSGVTLINLINNSSKCIFDGIAVENIGLFCSEDAPLFNDNLEGCFHDKMDIHLVPRFHFIHDLHKEHDDTHRYQPVNEHCVSHYYKNKAIHIKNSENAQPVLKLTVDNQLKCEVVDSRVTMMDGISLWDNSVLYATLDGSIEFRNNNLEMIEEETEADKVMPKQYSYLSSLSFRRVQSWRSEVLIALTTCNQLYIFVKDDEVLYNTMQKQVGTVTAVDFYLNLLILGTDVGVVYLYRIKESEDLLCLDLNAFDAMFDIADDPIKFVKFYQNGSLPAIVAATKRNVYRVFQQDCDF